MAAVLDKSLPLSGIMSCRHGCSPECDYCWTEALIQTYDKHGPEAWRRIEQYDECPDCGLPQPGPHRGTCPHSAMRSSEPYIPEPGMFGQPTALISVDWLQTAEDDFLRMAQELKPWFHRFIGWLGRI